MNDEPSASRPEARAKTSTTIQGSALRGLALMFVSTFLFSAMHASIRHLSDTIHPFEIAFFRSLFALIVVAPWFYREGLALLRTRHLGLHGLRAIFNVFAMLSFFYALSITPLSEVTALGFTAPIFTTLLAALVLGEAVRLSRWSAIIVGFAGTLIILRPGFAAIGPGQMLTLFSSLIWACALLIIKTLGRTEGAALAAAETDRETEDRSPCNCRGVKTVQSKIEPPETRASARYGDPQEPMARRHISILSSSTTKEREKERGTVTWRSVAVLEGGSGHTGARRRFAKPACRRPGHALELLDPAW
jgi:uncharacterized membrane protein